MKLSQILHGINVKSDYHDINITDITNDSRTIAAGCIYVAIQGESTDGHKFVSEVLKNGAATVLVQRDMGVANQIVVADTKKAYALACANFFKNPSGAMTLIGVTGTNGKTSTTSIIKNILQATGVKTGLIGTIEISYGDVVKETPHTTPDAYLFQQTLREMADAGCRYVVLEVSSHALIQQRVYGTCFEICVFTNLSPEHLDYHESMEAYFAAKTKLFRMGKSYLANANDPYGRRLATLLGEQCRTFLVEHAAGEDSGHGVHADFYACDVICQVDSVQFRMLHDGVTCKVAFAIPGRYSVENALAAIGVCKMLGISMETIVKALSSMKSIRGRSEILYQNDTITVIGDYAHTPDGIKNILESLSQVTQGRLVAVFGCGGDRDKIKRPLMAKACEKYADFIVVTSDNPRSEDPEAIIADIVPGFSPDTPYAIYPDRTQAIRYAITHAKPNDMIVLLGKGHEDYQVLKQGKIHYDEREIVAQIVGSM